MKYLPVSKYLFKSLIVVLVLAQLFALSAVAALAEPELKDPYEGFSIEEIRAELGLGSEAELLDMTDGEMEWLLQVGHRMAEYLVLNEDGTLSLTQPDLGYVGVDESFVTEYQEGLKGLNELVRMGWVTFDNEFNMYFTENMPVDPSAIEQGLQEIDEKVAGAALASDEELARFFGRGFGFRFGGGFHRAPFRFGSFHSSFGSRFGLGRFSHRFGLFFGGHGRSFFGHRSFSRGGFLFFPGRVFQSGIGHHSFFFRGSQHTYWSRGRGYF